MGVRGRAGSAGGGWAPGANRSRTAPQWENEARASVRVVAPTVTAAAYVPLPFPSRATLSFSIASLRVVVAVNRWSCSTSATAGSAASLRMR
ncbi:hypothetical protein [Actinosynnema mirum]|uniref:hypothetical protein n=1 Tax=Actinosynnema mirum TaxID=40567 RepID=UPI00118150E3|nr:hypothetical protein [Actinosynnema mirum]